MRRSLRTILLAALVIAVGSIAMADETKMQGKEMMHGMQGMDRMDADGDGEISREEFMQAHAEMFFAMHKNSDGKLDQEECRMMMEGMRHHDTSEQ